MWQARSGKIIYPIVVSLSLSAFLGAAIIWASQFVSNLLLTNRLLVAITISAVVILIIGFLNYDVLVLLSFCLIGFVRNEPAPFDLLLALLLLIGFLCGRLRFSNSRYGYIVLLGFWGLILTNLLSTMGSNLSAFTIRFLGITLYSLCIFLFIRMYVTRSKALTIVLIGYTVSAIINALLVVMSFFGLELPFSVLAWSARGVGFFKDANVYGPFLVVAAFWIIDRIMQTPFRIHRTSFMIVLAILLGIGAILSLSRAVWINVIFVCLFYFIFLIRHASLKSASFLVFAMGALVLVTAVVLQHLELFSLLREHWQIHDYDLVRFDIQRDGLIAGLTHPIGVGPGLWSNSHSLYVRTLAEQGIVGLFSLVLLIGGVVFPLMSYAWVEKTGTAGISTSMLLAIIFGQLVNSLVIDSIHWRHLWVVLGLAWAFQELHETKEI